MCAFPFAARRPAAYTQRMGNKALFGLVLALLGTSRCQCEDDLNQLSPDIVVTPEVMNLGDRLVGSLNEAGFTVGNEGTATVNVLGYDFEALTEAEQDELGGPFLDASGAAFSLVDGPDRVDANRSVDAVLGFLPAERGVYGGAMIVRSDDLETPAVRVPLVGNGGPPLIEAQPAEVSFGEVNEGPGASRIVRLVNVGYDTLNISDVYIQNGGMDAGGEASAFTLPEGQPLTATLAPEEALSVEVRMNPNEAAVAAAGGPDVSGILVAVSDAENEPELEVPLSGTVNLAPRAIAVELITRRTEVKVSVNRDVVVDGSETEDPEGDDFTFDWDLVEQPAESTAILTGNTIGPECTDDDGCDVAEGYLCVPGGTTRCKQVMRTKVKVDAVGTYVVRLRATDVKGAWREADVTILPRDFAVVLTWAAAPGAGCLDPASTECTDLSPNEQQLQCCGQTDLDLHLVRPAGTLGDYGTCPSECLVSLPSGGIENRCVEQTETYVDTCRSGGGDASFCNRYPEWGDTGRDDDPRLDLDDVRGNGPEVITLNEPADGSYTVVVHFCNDRITEPTVATVDFFVKGVLTETAGPQVISAEGDAWVAATAIRSGGPQDGTWQFLTPADLFDLNVDPDLCNQPECAQ